MIDVESIDELLYRPYDSTIAVDSFFGVDSGKTVEQSLTSLDKEEAPFCLGLFSGKANSITASLDEVDFNFDDFSDKRILFVRTCKTSDIKVSIDDELKQAVDVFSYIKRKFINSECKFLFLTDSLFKPMMPEGMYYAHIRIGNDGKPNEFERIVMGKLGLIVKLQKEGGLTKTRGMPYYAKNVLVGENELVPVNFDEETTYSIVRKKATFDIFTNIKSNSKKLIVFGQSALDQSSVSLPVFRRWSWSREIDHSCIVLSDPTLLLDKKLEAGWFVGTKDHYYTETMAEIISEISKSMGLSHTDIIFMGASAGGFTSMSMAAHLKGASCLVDVPQTDLTEYVYQHNAIQPLTEVAFGSRDYQSQLPANLTDRLSVSKVIEKTGYCPNIYFLQNSNDFSAGHVENQFSNFMGGLGALWRKYPSMRSAKIICESYDRFHLLKGGHFPLSKRKTLFYLERAIQAFS